MTSADGKVPTVVIAEDDPVIADEVRRVLEDLGLLVVAVVANGEGAVQEAVRWRPDLLVMDIGLEGHLDGIEAAHRLAASTPAPIVYLTGHADADTIRRAAGVSAAGYVLKPFTAAQLRAVVTLALSVGPSRPDVMGAQARDILSDIVDSLRRHGYATEKAHGWERRAVAAGLSRRELDVARGLVTGQRVATMAESLGLSEHTVRNHLKAVFRKVGVRSQADMVRWASIEH